MDSAYAAALGGRWNPAGSWPTLYLNRDLDTARAQIDRLLAGSPVEPEDLADDAFVLVAVCLPPSEVVDVVSEAGVRAAGLPDTYPLDADGQLVPHATCQAIGVHAHADGADGVEARSASVAATHAATELAWWPRDRSVRPVGGSIPYGRWRSGDVVDLATLVEEGAG